MKIDQGIRYQWYEWSKSDQGWLGGRRSYCWLGSWGWNCCCNASCCMAAEYCCSRVGDSVGIAPPPPCCSENCWAPKLICCCWGGNWRSCCWPGWGSWGIMGRACPCCRARKAAKLNCCCWSGCGIMGCAAPCCCQAARLNWEGGCWRGGWSCCCLSAASVCRRNQASNEDWSAFVGSNDVEGCWNSSGIGKVLETNGIGLVE